MNRLSWLWRPATAWALAGLTVLLAVALVPLSLAARQNLLAAGGTYLVLAMSFGVVGLVVAWHRPQNPLGWLMLVRGAVRILAPEAIMGFAANLLRNKQMMPVAAAVTSVLGLVFCYFGYAT